MSGKYVELKEKIKKRILSQEFKERERLPSLRQLAKEYDMSLVTVKLAIESLANEKLVYTKHGSGTFVSLQNKSDLASSIHDIFIIRSDRKNISSTLTFLNNEMDSSLNKIWDEVIRKFNKEIPWINIKQVNPTGELDEIINLYNPDVILTSQQTLFELTEKELIIELDPYINSDNDIVQNNFFQQVLKTCKINGRFMALPVNIGMPVVFFNKELLERESVNYPNEKWTWQDYIKVSNIISNRDEGKYGVGITLDPVSLLIYFDKGLVELKNYQNGSSFKNIEEFLNIFKQFNKKELGLIYPEKGFSYEKEEAFKLFLDNKLAVFIGWIVWFNSIKSAKFEFGITTIPHSTNGANLYGTMVSAVCKNTNLPKEAFEFIKFITGTSVRKLFMDIKHNISPLKELTCKDEFLNSSSILKELEKSVFFKYPRQTYVDFQEKVIYPEFSNFFNDKQSVQDTLNNIKNRASIYFRFNGNFQKPWRW